MPGEHLTDDGDGVVQVITSEMKYSDELADYIERKGLGEAGSKFRVVGIIGGQSSGKSTLLNRMFGTDFDMMDSKTGRRQTTKGIWCGKARGQGTLVLDVEGTDGREKEDQKAFEGKSALFCLALTDVMMVNMWMHEVGRFNAANLPLLKTVFEVHLRLLSGEASDSKPLLLFVLRDCDGSTPVESLRETIEADLSKIWGEIRKPEAHADASLSDFFEVQCESLPHFVYQKDEWAARVEEVAARFSSGEVFEGRGSKDVPAEGFSDYACQLWETIEKDGDLDLPTQRKMLSMVRCEAKRKTKIDCFKDSLPDWLDSATKETFKGLCEEKVGELGSVFRAETKGYDVSVAEECASKLLADAWGSLQDVHDSMVRDSREQAEVDYEKELNALLPEPGTIPSAGFSSRAEAVASSVKSSFREAVDALTPKDAPWKERLHDKDGHFDILDGHVRREAAAAKKALAGQVQEACNLVLKKKLSAALVTLLDVASPNMWGGIRKAHSVCVGEASEKIKAILEDVGMWSEADGAKCRASLRDYADVLVNDKVSDKASEASLLDKAFSKFDLSFNRGKTRVWRLWDSPDVEFDKAKMLGLSTLEMFASSQLYEEGDWPKGPSAAPQKPRYIEEDRMEKLTAEFESKARPELAWAQVCRASSSTHSSLIVGGLVLVLGWNEIVWLIYNPLYLILLIATSVGGGVYYFLNRVGDSNQLIGMIITQFTGVMNVPSAQGGAGGSYPGLAHAKHLDGPSGREKRPMSAPVKSTASSAPATRAGSAGNVLKED